MFIIYDVLLFMVTWCYLWECVDVYDFGIYKYVLLFINYGCMLLFITIFFAQPVFLPTGTPYNVGWRIREKLYPLKGMDTCDGKIQARVRVWGGSTLLIHPVVIHT